MQGCTKGFSVFFYVDSDFGKGIGCTQIFFFVEWQKSILRQVDKGMGDICAHPVEVVGARIRMKYTLREDVQGFAYEICKLKLTQIPRQVRQRDLKFKAEPNP